MGRALSLTLCSAGKRTEFTRWPTVKHNPSTSKEHIQPLAGRVSSRGHARLVFLQRGKCATSWVLGELQSHRQHADGKTILTPRKPFRTKEKQNFVILLLLDLEAKCRGCRSGTQVFYANSSCWASVSSREMGSLVSTEGWRGHRALSLREQRCSM